MRKKEGIKVSLSSPLFFQFCALRDASRKSASAEQKKREDKENFFPLFFTQSSSLAKGEGGRKKKGEGKKRHSLNLSQEKEEKIKEKEKKGKQSRSFSWIRRAKEGGEEKKRRPFFRALLTHFGESRSCEGGKEKRKEKKKSPAACSLHGCTPGRCRQREGRKRKGVRDHRFGDGTGEGGKKRKESTLPILIVRTDATGGRKEKTPSFILAPGGGGKEEG